MIGWFVCHNLMSDVMTSRVGSDTSMLILEHFRQRGTKFVVSRDAVWHERITARV